MVKPVPKIYQKVTIDLENPMETNGKKTHFFWFDQTFFLWIKLTISPAFQTNQLSHFFDLFNPSFEKYSKWHFSSTSQLAFKTRVVLGPPWQMVKKVLSPCKRMMFEKTLYVLENAVGIDFRRFTKKKRRNLQRSMSFPWLIHLIYSPTLLMLAFGMCYMNDSP